MSLDNTSLLSLTENEIEESLLEFINEASDDFSEAVDFQTLENSKAKYLGKSGKINLLLKSLSELPSEKRKLIGSFVNKAKIEVESLLLQNRVRLETLKIEKQLASERIDITLPGIGDELGSIHPVMQVQLDVFSIFSSMGFVQADGPEIETDWFNFTALNMPSDHPARSMHDTFYFKNTQTGKVREDILLRTHTSPVQMRAMKAHIQKYQATEKQVLEIPDLRIIAPGRVFRVDSDATHAPMFHQVEGMWIGKKISFSNLKWVLKAFLASFFEKDDLAVRFRPSFFPFTEPSAELDLSFSNKNGKQEWLEIGGCGMIHPNVLEFGGFDSSQYSGFAFGCGLDRLAMLRYDIRDLRLFTEGDIRFLSQFC